MAKVRTITAIDAGTKKETFVYKGYYAIKGGSRSYHTQKVLRNNTILQDAGDDDDVFEMDSTRFDTPEYFKEIVDEHIAYIEKSFGNLNRYYRLNTGDF